jgi:soluble lytic murein transglycosylase
MRTVVCFVLSCVLFVIGCSAQQSEEQALESLRQMTRTGKLPSEDVVAGIESRFANRPTGALARLLRGWIKYQNKDFAGAAALLNSDVFEKRTQNADYALWLRGRALQQAGDHTGAMKAFSDLMQRFPTSLRLSDARMSWARSAIEIGSAANVLAQLKPLVDENNGDALVLAARSLEATRDAAGAMQYYRRAYFFAPGSPAAKEAEAKMTASGQQLMPQTATEAAARAEQLLKAKKFSEATTAYAEMVARFPAAVTPKVQLDRVSAAAQAGRMQEALLAFNALPESAREREEAYRQMVVGYAKARMWPQARATVEEMRRLFPSGSLVPKAMAEAGYAARDAKNRSEEIFFLSGVVAAYPNSIEVAGAQFELAWANHESRSYALSSQMLIEHLSRYADKDTTNRGKAGYWAARDSERAGKIAEACTLYDALLYRYSANWYGYLAADRLDNLRKQGHCRANAVVSPTVAKAAANLKTVTVAAETSTDKERERAKKADELSVIGLFDWAIDELNEAKKTAGNSPKVNMALARHYRLKGDNVNALLALARSYPDYSQMFPEEMGREEWDIFYPLNHWKEIRHWANERRLDPFQIAGLIRQESVFDPNAKSHADAHGLMQLLVPTARSMARKYAAATSVITPAALYQPPLNIELGTAYMRDQFDKFGRIEYVAVAYNAGPGRVPQWRAALPAEIDEFVEAIPFRETKGYVQGVIRNTAQYRRLYDENGNFKPNVGSKPLRGEIDSKERDQFRAEFPDVIVTDVGGNALLH